MRKAVVFLSVLLIMTGCATKPKLTLMVGGASNELDQWGKVVSAFEKKTGIDVTLIRQASDTEQRKQSILVALRGKKSDPDVMLMDVAWVGQIAAAGWLEPLDIYKNIDTSKFFQSVLKLADTYDDHLVALPVYVDGGLLYYRKDLLKKYGFKNPPTTWNELLTQALTVQKEEKKKNENFWGFVWQGAQYEGLICDALEYFASAGGGFLDKNGKPVLDSPANEKALQFMVNLVQKYHISPPNTYTDMKEEEVRMLFQNGDALFERNWPYAYALHNATNSAVRGKFDIAPLPAFKGGKSASTLGGWHIGVSKYSEQKENAVKLVAFITSYAIQKQLSLALGWNPGRTDVYDDAEIQKKNPYLKKLKTVFEGAVPRPSLPYYSELSQSWQKNINAALSGKVSVKDALSNAQKETKMVIEEYAQ